MEIVTNEMGEAESDAACKEGELIGSMDSNPSIVKEKTLSRHSGKKARKHILNSKALFQAGLQSNAKKASSRKL